MRLVFLGIAGSVPARDHNTMSLLVGDYLFDCGEGALRALQTLGLTDVIDQVFITHVHADHISGLVSLIWYYMLTGRKRELLIAGPQGLRNTVLSLMEAMGTPLDRVEPWLRFRELKAGERIGCVLTARALHPVPSLAYRIDLERAICYTGDTSPTEEVIRLAKGCDLLIHEATYPPGMEKEASLSGHSTARDAGIVAEEAGVEALALVHLPFYMFQDEGFVGEYIEGASKHFGGKVFVPRELEPITL